ncbi:MAG: hypothetical protein ACPGWR_07765 [Ardenticatenaceae bacterium]
MEPIKEETNLAGGIVGGVTGAAVGGMLGTALADLPLEGLIIGGLLGVVAGGLLLNGEQKRNEFPTGKQVDIYFNTHPPLSRYIEDKLKRGIKVEGNLHFLSNDEFVEECIEYITQHMNLDTGVHYSEEEAEELALGSSGYLFMRKIYINQDKAHAGTVIHEAVHLFQEARYAKELGRNINEGTTEYFTRLLCDSHQLTRHPKYRLQYECIEQLVNLCGQEKLAEAYFLGNISVLERVVDATKGQRTFMKWKKLMEDRDFKEANQLLSQ